MNNNPPQFAGLPQAVAAHILAVAAAVDDDIANEPVFDAAEHAARRIECAAHGLEADAVWHAELQAAEAALIVYGSKDEASTANLRGLTPCAAYWHSCDNNGQLVPGGPEAYFAAEEGSALERYDGTPVNDFPTWSFGVRPVNGTGTFLVAYLSRELRAAAGRAMHGDLAMQ